MRKALYTTLFSSIFFILFAFMLIQWVVVKWKQLGRELGFPTANVDIGDLVLDPVVSCCTLFLWDEILYGVGTYLSHKKFYEVYIFDFDRDIYGQKLKIELWQRIRYNKNFDNLTDLKEQIEHDVRDAKTILHYSSDLNNKS